MNSLILARLCFYITFWIVLTGKSTVSFHSVCRFPTRLGPRFGERVVRPPEANIFHYKVESISSPGVHLPLRQYYGKKAYVVVNVATKSEVAEQHFAELQTLYDRYKNYGLEILAFPSNSFENEPRSNTEILEHVTSLNVTFPVFGKIECQQGVLTHPLYKYLSKSIDNGWLGPDIRRDFVRFVVNKLGIVVKRFHPNTPPLVMEPLIKSLLLQREPGEGEKEHDDWFSALSRMNK